MWLQPGESHVMGYVTDLADRVGDGLEVSVLVEWTNDSGGHHERVFPIQVGPRA
jgi:hypothetical protein